MGKMSVFLDLCYGVASDDCGSNVMGKGKAIERLKRREQGKSGCKSPEIDLHRNNAHLLFLCRRYDHVDKALIVRFCRIYRQQDCIEIEQVNTPF